MNEQDYIELIEREVAGTISPDERDLLREYMRKTPGAEKIYEDVLQTSRLLSRVGDVEPPGYLKARIMNSLDFGRYQARSGRPVLRFLTRVRQAGLKPRLAYAFALGTVVGLVVYSMFMATPGGRYGPGVREMYGTIGIDEKSRFAPVESVPVDMPGAAGCVNLLRFEDLLNLEISLSGEGVFDVLVDYEPAHVGFSGLSPVGEGETLLKVGDGRIGVSGSEGMEFLLTFVKLSARAVPLDVEIKASGQKALGHRFVVEDDETVPGGRKPDENGK